MKKTKRSIFIILTMFYFSSLFMLTQYRAMRQTYAEEYLYPSAEAMILRQPTSVTAPVGTNALFFVEAFGDRLRYQWQTSKDGGKSWIDSSMPGNKTPMLTIDIIEGRDGYQFRCLITSQNRIAVSDVAELNVGDAGFTICRQPEECTCALGETAQFTVEAEGSGLEYLWLSSRDDGKTWIASDLPGSTNNMLSIKAIDSRNNYQFRCVISGANGAIVSDAVTLKIAGKTGEDEAGTNTLRTYANKNDMMWSYLLSVSPIVASYKGINDRIYWGYTTQDGYCGVASYDFRTGEIMKTHLKHEAVDDHNNLSVFIKDRHVVVSYPTGHNTGNTMNFQISTGIESIENFRPAFQHESDGTTCYGQFFEYNDVLYSFFRNNNISWRCVSSTDGGYEWGNEKQIISAPFQYYCKFQETTTPGLLRMCMYSNPAEQDPSIRMGFLDLASGSIYNSDAQTRLGDWNGGVRYDAFEQIIIPEHTQRLFDVAVTALNDPSILIGQFSRNDTNNAAYYWYKNGELIYICDAGACIHYSYQNGICFFGTDRIVVSRSDEQNVIGGNDYVEIWRLGETPSLEKLIYKEEKGTIPIRNFRPITDSNQRVILWLRGYYDQDSYTQFKTDAMIYVPEEDIIIW